MQNTAPIPVSAGPAPWIEAVLRAVEPGADRDPHVIARPVHSNEVVEVRLRDGRSLMLKRARHAWVRECFAASAAASRLIVSESEMVVPRPLPEPNGGDAPVQVYWRIPLPTLEELWPKLDEAQRLQALRSLGALTRRLHAIRPRGFGPLHRTAGAKPLEQAMAEDLRDRLLPALHAHWPSGVAPLEQLLQCLEVLREAGTCSEPSLVHGDLHLGNVLCRLERHGIACVGFLDLDSARGGAPEHDVAGFEALHGPLFQRPLRPALLRSLREGYGSMLSARVIAFFRCAHLANQGFTSGFLGHAEHAAAIAAELTRRVSSLHGLANGRRRARPLDS